MTDQCIDHSKAYRSAKPGGVLGLMCMGRAPAL